MADNPPGTDRDLGTGQGRQGGANICRTLQKTQARGAETSGGGWQVAGGKKLQVDDVTHRERMWGLGER